MADFARPMQVDLRWGSAVHADDRYPTDRRITGWQDEKLYTSIHRSSGKRCVGVDWCGGGDIFRAKLGAL